MTWFFTLIILLHSITLVIANISHSNLHFDNDLINDPSLSSLFNSIDNVLHSMNYFLSSLPPNIHLHTPSSSLSSRLPPFRDTDTERTFFIDLPGFHRSNVNVDLIRDRIISAERKCDKKDAYCIPRTIKQNLSIGDEFDAHKVTVNLDAGELRIHLPKLSAHRFTIPIVDKLFGLNQASNDPTGEPVKVHTIKSTPLSISKADYIDLLATSMIDTDNPETYNQYMTAINEAIQKVSQANPNQWVDSLHKEAQHVATEVVDNVKDKAYKVSDSISKSSEQVQKKVDQAAGQVHDSIHQAADQAHDTLKGTAGTVKQGAAYVTDTTKDKFEEVKRTSAMAKDQIKNKASNLFGWFGDQYAGIEEAVHECEHCVHDAILDGYKEGKEKHHTERALRSHGHEI